MVLVLGILGAWGRGKTVTETCFQDIAKNRPWELEFRAPQVILGNYLSAYIDYYVMIRPKIEKIFNRFTGKDTPVVDLFDFLKRPPNEDGEYCLVIDDIYAWLASYHFGSAINDTATSVMAGGRKKNISIIESSVRFKDVDPRIRALHTHLFLPKVLASGLCALERYVVDVFEDRRLMPDIYFDARAYYDKYDTREVIESAYNSDLSTELIQERAQRRQAVIQKSAPRQIAVAPTIPASSAIPSRVITNANPREYRVPDGSASAYIGAAVQREIAQRLRKRYPMPEYVIREGQHFGSGIREPDIIVFKGEKPFAVYSVKSCALAPYR
ncbi:MAG: hypothetical protein ACRDF4_08465, partial [Rhabdochlamydiaceae bacterium]